MRFITTFYPSILRAIILSHLIIYIIYVLYVDPFCLIYLSFSACVPPANLCTSMFNNVIALFIYPYICYIIFIVFMDTSHACALVLCGFSLSSSFHFSYPAYIITVFILLLYICPLVHLDYIYIFFSPTSIIYTQSGPAYYIHIFYLHIIVL